MSVLASAIAMATMIRQSELDAPCTPAGEILAETEIKVNPQFKPLADAIDYGEARLKNAQEQRIYFAKHGASDEELERAELKIHTMKDQLLDAYRALRKGTNI